MFMSNAKVRVVDDIQHILNWHSSAENDEVRVLLPPLLHTRQRTCSGLPPAHISVARFHRCTACSVAPGNTQVAIVSQQFIARGTHCEAA
jgi:hypothetical protein